MLDVSFAVLFGTTLISSTLIILHLSMSPWVILVAEADVYYCLRYLLFKSTKPKKPLTALNVLSLAVSAAVFLIHLAEYILCSKAGVIHIYTQDVFHALHVWMLLYLIFRAAYFILEYVLCRGEREVLKAWYLDEDVLVEGRVCGDRFFPDTEKCGFASQRLYKGSVGSEVFFDLDEAFQTVGEAPVITKETQLGDK